MIPRCLICDQIWNIKHGKRTEHLCLHPDVQTRDESGEYAKKIDANGYKISPNWCPKRKRTE